jgi:stearoyl-CoA desaturase (delta-9 desaturase)
MTNSTLTPETRRKPILAQEIAFAAVHLVPLGALYTGATRFDWMYAFFVLLPYVWVTVDTTVTSPTT